MHYRVELTGISKKTDADGTMRETRVTIPTGEYYTTDTAHSLRIPADSWQFDSVELKVTRIGRSAFPAGASTAFSSVWKRPVNRPPSTVT